MVGPHVLLVRSPDGSNRLEDALGEAGCTVTTAETATAALERLATDQIDCLVSEFELPGDNGQALQSAAETLAPEVPFVLYNDNDSDSGAIESTALDREVDSVVRKNGQQSVDRLVETVTASQSTAASTEPKRDISGHEPTKDEIAAAIDEAPIGMSLSDPSLTDYPLVYANDAWTDVTGYDTDEILGRNPRLLQGPQTDPETVKQLSKAISNKEPVSVEIRNYKRDGTPFWNELTVAPVYEDGELAHYVGFQIDVTDRREAEQLAEERARKLDDQRRVLKRVLTRVNGLLSEVSGVLVESTNHEEIAYRVCDAVATEPGYAASWICTVDPTETTLSLSASSGLPTETPSELSLDDAPTAVRRAVETNELQWTDADSTETPLDPSRVGGRRLLVVPLCYGERRYGLLGVYGTDTEVLDRREQQVFESLGTMIANGLHAVEATRLLTTDHVTALDVEIHDSTFQLSEIAAAVGGRIDRCGTTRTDSGDCELYLRTTESIDLDSIASVPSVRSPRIVSAVDGETTLSVTLSELAPDDDLAELGAVVTDLTATADGVRLTIEAPPQQDVRSLLDSLRACYESVDLRARTERDRRGRQPNEFTAAVEDRLTDRQKAALKAAQLNGYFEWPRPVDGDEIAKTMGITRQTFHQHLRAAEQKLVDAYIEAC